jgi:hypothetical protein
MERRTGTLGVRYMYLPIEMQRGGADLQRRHFGPISTLRANIATFEHTVSQLQAPSFAELPYDELAIRRCRNHCKHQVSLI